MKFDNAAVRGGYSGGSVEKRPSLRVYIFFPPVTAVVTLGDFLKVKQIQPNVIPGAVKDLTAMFIKPRSRPTSGLSWTDTLFHRTLLKH